MVIIMSKNIFKENNFLKLEKNLKNNEKISLFLDYDGTLSHFTKNPEVAKPVKGVKKVIEKISNFNFVNITIISGRSLQVLTNMIKLDNIYYAGLHGLEMQNQQPLKLNRQKIKKYKELIKNNYSQAIKNDQVYIEDKKFVLSIHHRDNFKNVNKLKKFLDNLIDDNKYEVMVGRKILEIKPKNWNKGKTVKMLRNSFFKNQKPFEIYIGDDTTDEDAFSVINGISIYVKNQSKMSPKANFYLNNPDEVLLFLKKLKKLLERKN